MVARMVRDHKVVGSNPVASTIDRARVFTLARSISLVGNTGFEGRQAKRSFAQVGGHYRRLDNN